MKTNQLKKHAVVISLLGLVTLSYASPWQTGLEKAVSAHVLQAQSPRYRANQSQSLDEALAVFKTSVAENKRTDDGYYVGAYELMTAYFAARPANYETANWDWFEKVNEKFSVPRHFSEEVFRSTNPYHNLPVYYGPASAFDYLKFMVNRWRNRKPVKYNARDAQHKFLMLKQDQKAYKQYKKELKKKAKQAAKQKAH